MLRIDFIKITVARGEMIVTDKLISAHNLQVNGKIFFGLTNYSQT